MKKTILFVAVLCMSLAVFADDAPTYKLRIINSNLDTQRDVETEKISEKDMQGRDQCRALNVELSASEIIKILNATANEVFVISNLDPYGAYKSFSAGLDGIKCNIAGTYNIYLKTAYDDNWMYIESATGSIGGGGGSDCQDGPYAVLLNDKDTVWAEATGEPDYQNRTQYLAHVSANANDVIKLLNASCDAKWMVDVEPYGEYAAFEGGQSSGKLTCKKAGCYDFYIKLKMDDDVLYIGEGTECGKEQQGGGGSAQKGSYGSQVPSQCGDVMLQAFYYDSYAAKTYNSVKFPNTKWATLNEQASEIGAYFDMVWLPPSAKSSGGTGYHPSQYSNQNSAWGSRTELEQFIRTMHNSPRKTKVIADIVVNHANNKSTWCDYYPLDFGSYGKFEPDATWITSNDEVWSSTDSRAKKCTKGSNAKKDDGYGDEANYAAARDWDHTQAGVQNMCKSYLKWMYNNVGYDGWRYDYCKGFHTSHVGDYNKASGAYFSVMEWWDGNVTTLQQRLQESGWNTLTFDFATKYEAFNRGIAQGNYSGCKSSGLLGAGKSKYAVTFIDSHDSFQRDDNEMCGKGKSLNSANKNKVLQANAFLLSMPGVPCVFYPHWIVFKDEISKMIMARHAAGVHSESAVSDSGDNSGYEAYVTGKTGMLCLQLGNKVGNAPNGYKTACKGTGFAVHYKADKGATPSVMVTPGSSVFKDKTAGITVAITAAALEGTPAIYYTTDGTEPTTFSNKLIGKTLNFKQTTTLKVMAVAGGAQSAVQTFTYTYKEPQDVNTKPITVRFAAPASWGGKVYLYAWSGADLGKWPGLQLSKDSEGWYSYTFEKGMASTKFIFNGGMGADQTSDLFTDEDVCYSWSGGAEKLEPECILPTGVEKVEDAQAVMQIYPNPVHDILNITTEEPVLQAYIYTVTGQCRRMVEGDIHQIDVAGMNNGMYILNVLMKNGRKATRLFVKE